jgi:hypothetical protein
MAFLRGSSSMNSLDPYYLVPEKLTNKTVNMGIMDPKYIRKQGINYRDDPHKQLATLGEIRIPNKISVKNYKKDHKNHYPFLLSSTSETLLNQDTDASIQRSASQHIEKSVALSSKLPKIKVHTKDALQ